MIVATAQDMRNMDARMIQDISSTKLMQQAAQTVYDVICERFKKGSRILIVCGSGNNGGDGYALAYLARNDFAIDILAVEKPRSDDAIYFYSLVKDHVTIHTTVNMQSYDGIVDAIFGTGLHREITGENRNLIEHINRASAYKIAVDIPSGVHSDTGQILGIAVEADCVVTFQFAKRGMYLYPGYTCCKEIVVTDIGIHKKYQIIKKPMTILHEANVAEMFPKREAHSHKGSYGKVLMIGGSASMHGAITLAADSALHSGVGTLTLCIPSVIREIVSMKLTEAMLLSVPSEDGYFDKEAVSIVKKNVEAYDVLMIGCGIGRGEVVEQLLQVVLQSNKPCVIDADALYVLGKHPDLLKRDAPVIVTPHLKEFSYISHIDMSVILSNPIQAAETFLTSYPNVTLVLKDERTLLFHQQAIYLNIRGSDALAKGGSGDVLCGLITSLFAQGKNALVAACCGVYIHALSGEYSATKFSKYSVLPHELRNSFDKIFQELSSVTIKEA